MLLASVALADEIQGTEKLHATRVAQVATLEQQIQVGVLCMPFTWSP